MICMDYQVDRSDVDKRYRYTALDYKRQFQTDESGTTEEKTAAFRRVQEMVRDCGITYEDARNWGQARHVVTEEAQSTPLDEVDWQSFLPANFIGEILTYRAKPSVSRQYCNVYTAPKGQETLKFRIFTRFAPIQMVKGSAKFKSRTGDTKVEEVTPIVLGDRFTLDGQAREYLGIEQETLNLNEMSKGFRLWEDRLFANALYWKTRRSYSEEYGYDNVETVVPSGDGGRWTYQDLLDARLSMMFPTATSAPNMNEQQRAYLQGVHVPGVALVSSSVYRDLVTDINLQDQRFWANSKILDDGRIDSVIGMSLVPFISGRFDSRNNWIESSDCYLLDTDSAGLDMVYQPGGEMQVETWRDQNNRRWETQVWEVLNCHVRNGFAVRRLTTTSEEPY